jgi:hypothetical protein
MPTSEGTPTSVVTGEAEGMSTTAGSQQQQKRPTQQKRQQLHDFKYSKSATAGKHATSGTLGVIDTSGKFATGAVDTYSSEYLPPL